MNTNILFKRIENKNKLPKRQITEAPLVSLIMLFIILVLFLYYFSYSS
jgi:ABC-type Na+ efflux pump permease subunit